MATAGISAEEARQVLSDVLTKRGVPRGLWRATKRGVSLLVGSRVVELPIRAGLQFYALQAEVRRLERICEEIEALQADRMRARQVDLEDLIAEARP